MNIRFAESGPGAEPAQTVVSLFDDIVGEHGEHTALAVKRAGEWKSWSYRKYYVDCFTAAKAMVEVREGGGRERERERGRERVQDMERLWWR